MSNKQKSNFAKWFYSECARRIATVSILSAFYDAGYRDAKKGLSKDFNRHINKKKWRKKE